MSQDNTSHNTLSNNEAQKQIIENDINQDLLRLREMNQAFAKMNQQYIHENNEYYSYYLQEMSSLSICQGQQHGQQESLIYYGENGPNTERSNSLLFALSEKDDDDTRPTTNLNHFHLDSNKYHNLQAQNQNKSKQLQSVQKNVFTDLNCPQVHQSRYYQSTFSHVQNEKKEKNQIQGFSKYAEFAIKISKIFNVQVEDLEIIYNQLQVEKQQASSQGLVPKVQVTDSEVMKKLFDYALKIKNSHNRLMDMITTIDSQISKRPKMSQNTVTQTQLENVSLNFLLEEELSRSQLNNHQQKHQGNDQKINKNTIIFPQIDNYEQNSTLQSKNTIFRKLQSNPSPQSPTFQIHSGETIQSFNSMVYSQKTETKSHKSRMKSKVTERIKLISEQLQSLKQQIDKDDQCEEQNLSMIKQKQDNQPYQLHVFSEIKEKTGSDFESRQKVKTPPFSIQRSTSSIKKDESIEQKKPQTNLTQTRESQPYPLGRQSFTYLKSAKEITQEDPQIDRKIQQTIKTCIVKSSSKKSQELKQNQKIIVEPAPVQTSNKKYSFKSQSFQTSESPKIDTKAQNREKMFRSIVQIRKSFSKDKKTFKNSPIKTEVKKTSNIAYLEDQQNNQKQSIITKKNLSVQKPFQKKSQIVEIGSIPIQQSSVISQETPHFLSSQHIQFINENSQNVTIQQHELPTQRINYPKNYSQVSLKREPSQEKIKFFQPIRYLDSAKTVQSRPFIESEKYIQKHIVNEPKVIYHPNQTFNPPPTMFPGDQKIRITISPKNNASFHPHYFNMNSNSVPSFRVPSTQKISISRPVTPIQIVKSQNFIPQNLAQRSFSTQKLHINNNASPRYVYTPRANNFFEVRKNNPTIANQSFNNNSLINRPTEVRAITQRACQPEIIKRNASDRSSVQTPCFSERSYNQSQKQAMIESINLKKKTLVEPKLQQSFMYYGPINPTLQKNLQQSNLATFRKDQSVVTAFPIQPYQFHKMSNSVYARQKIPEKKSENGPQTPRIPKSLRPPKYVPPKQAEVHQQKVFDFQSNKYYKTLDESKPLPLMDESKKSHIAINASSVKSPQYDLQDSPSFGVYNDQSYANTFFVSPSRPFSSAFDSRDSSESKRSAASSRSKSGKKGIALESKRIKTPPHTFVQSSYMP